MPSRSAVCPISSSDLSVLQHLEPARSLARDLASVNALRKYSLVGGVGVSTLRKPRVNAGGDPYFTDGLRAVLFIASEPVPITDIKWLDWRAEPMPADPRRPARHPLASTICACRAPHNVVHADLALGVVQIEENGIVAHAQAELA